MVSHVFVVDAFETLDYCQVFAHTASDHSACLSNIWFMVYFAFDYVSYKSRLLLVFVEEVSYCNAISSHGLNWLLLDGACCVATPFH